MTASPVHDPAASFDAVAGVLTVAFESWLGEIDGWSEENLDEWAITAFTIQYHGNIPYRRYCEAREVYPGEVRTWRDVPPVATAAFRAVDLIVGKASDAELVFRTSGTTRGPDRRGRHLVRRADLYRASLRSAFRCYVLDADKSHIIVTLLPSFTFERDSSLGWMLDDVREGLGAAGSIGVAGSGGIDWEALTAAVEEAADRPVCVLGTTLSFAAWRERLAAHEASAVRLAPGSRLMDTGGVKGKPGLVRDELMFDLASRLGLGDESVVNEFGMTELLSQRYGTGLEPVTLAGPPWLRTRVLDPVTLEEMPDGESGILCHFDLANLGSVCAVLTEDRGRIVEGGVEWLGRTPGAPPRGCSLATAQLLDAQSDA